MNPGADNFDLARFVAAQEGMHERALGELRSGRKRSHWMWFVFPQVAGLGSSVMAQKYAIRSRAEAEAYLAHPVLGPRLRECAQALLAVEGRSATEIMGQPDDVKLRSSMTLFAALAGPGSDFQRVLEKFFSGEADERTLDFLRQSGK
jgi:uncharacterized protein (DUF1810 family)